MPVLGTFGTGSSRNYGLGSSIRFIVGGGSRTEVDIEGVPYTLFTFTEPGTLSIEGGGSLVGTVLTVGAGFNGGGPSPSQYGGNGGRGGGLLQTTRIFRAGSHAVVRGAAPGGNSTITLPYGSPVASPPSGGGAGGSGSYFFTVGTSGANGNISNISGTDVYYGGGGGGGGTGGPPSSSVPTAPRPGRPGGLGGGGPGGYYYAQLIQSPPLGGFTPFYTSAATPGNPGGANTGGGGGGGGGNAPFQPGGTGGPGIVVVRFRTSLLAPA